MIKEQRQQIILDLIRARKIETQDELTAILVQKNFGVTQSSVSRDLDELGIVKINGYYSPPVKSDQNFGMDSLETAGDSLIVAKCELGLASAVTVQIDRAKIAEIVGTIAGEDTIFIAVKDKKAQKSVMKQIWQIFDK